MARLEQLLETVPNGELKDELVSEVAALKGRVRFGLVYERHIPETVVVGDIDGLKVGDHVRPRAEANNGHDYRVLQLNGKKASIVSLDSGDAIEVALGDLLAVRRFGDPTDVGLTPLGAVRRSEERGSHVVIEGENFHALQLLAFAYEGQVDCCYLDPPYNTGAKDWTYNNRFVDANDSYRHSKWLSMMEKRLRLTKRLLKPDGVLICTIDENELYHLGVLLEELFPNARRQLVSIVINPAGASGEGLSRVEEYAFFCFLGDAEPVRVADDMLTGDGLDADTEDSGLTWESLLRRGNAWYRARRRNLCYPILIGEDGTKIVGVGPPLEEEDESKRPLEVDGYPAAWPVRRDGRLGIWRVDGARLTWLAERGYAHVARRDDSRGTWAIRYLMSGTVEAIEAGLIEVTGRGERGEVEGRVSAGSRKIAKTVWYRGRHNAGGSGGTQLLSELLGARDLFAYPKSVYAVRDCLRVAVGDRPNALILDFFAGSGTTLHSTLLLNQEDGQQRRCILVTNNEVNPDLRRKLGREGHLRGTPGYEQHGIFQAVTRPRCEAAINGERQDGTSLSGNYLGGSALSDGFEENVAFFALDYLDPDRLELGESFDAVHPLLWLAAGGRGEMPEVPDRAPYLINAAGGYGVLFREDALRDFEAGLEAQKGISLVALVSDSEEAYVEFRERVGGGRQTLMLYRDLLRHYRRRVRL